MSAIAGLETNAQCLPGALQHKSPETKLMQVPKHPDSYPWDSSLAGKPMHALIALQHPTPE
jgi:hypothetical protein